MNQAPARRVMSILLPGLVGALATRARGGPLTGTVVVVRPMRGVFRLRSTHRVVWVSEDLAALGVAPPMRVVDAQRYAPALDVALVDERAVIEETRALAELCLALSPVVEPDPSVDGGGVIHVDCTGLPRSPRALLEHARAILVAHGQRPALALAPGKVLATALAKAALLFRRGEDPPLIAVDDAHRAEIVHRLPLVVLPLTPERIADLHALGLETVGDLVRLFAQPIGGRLDDETRALADVLAGHDNTPVKGLVVEDEPREELALEHGIVHLEALGFVLLPLLARLVGRLAARGERLVALELSVFVRPLSFDVDEDRAPRPATARTFLLSFPEPVDEARALLAAALLRVESALTLGQRDDGEIVRVVVAAKAGARVPARQVTFDFVDEPPVVGDDRALAGLLAEWVTELGPDRVGRLVPEPALLPERMTRLSLSEEDRPAAKEAAGRFLDGWPWPVRLLREPVVLTGARVVASHAFARLEGDDGSDTPFERAYRVLVLADGRKALAFDDDEEGQTRVQGWFD